MNDQLELEIRLGIDEAVEEQNAIADCAKLLFNGQPELHFTFDMTCSHVATCWYDMIEKGEQWEARYQQDIQACHDELKEIGSRDRKRRAPVKARLARFQNLAEIGKSLCEQAYQSAIDELDEKVHAQWKEKFADFDEEFAHDDFWQSVSDEHYHELTGCWTIQDAADTAIEAAVAEDVLESPTFRKAYIIARKREDGRVRMTSSEYSFGAGFIRRLCALEGETFYNIDGKPDKKMAGATCAAPACIPAS